MGWLKQAALLAALSLDQHKYYRNINDRSYLDNYDWVHLLDYNRREHYCGNYVNDKLVFFFRDFYRVNDNVDDIYCQFVFIGNFYRAYDNVDQLVFFIGNLHRANNHNDIYHQLFFFVFIRDLHRANNDFHYVYLNYHTSVDSSSSSSVEPFTSSSSLSSLEPSPSSSVNTPLSSTPVPSSTVDNTPSTTQQTTSASASASGVIALAVINGGAPIAIEEIFNLQPGEAAVVELEFIDPETGQPTKAVVVFQALGCRGVPPGESPFGGRTTSIGSDYVQASCAVYCSRNRFTFTSVNRGVCYCGSEQKELTLIDQSQCAAAGNNKKRHWFRKRQSGGAVDAVNLFAVIPAADVVITPATTTLSPSSLPTLPLANTGPLSTIVTTRFWVYLDWVWDSFDPFR
ncbi:hypothetical protein Cob_v005360 [Colletotrichum orbiculare MAFF 240422]|uniref:WSC domain-containing protein n=1 Tax=Colletotrichum orbiculare (strain 104-T / ATCC 96160 / CBS 514.97 / LARS 414 / MAFF 240422) TaxID=1213857 RepID=A0A484FVC5_COLOR|nr:hypothetical protein Cob_v005360 [Colletotrichum orbiculare MAFF 240422]